MRNSEISRRVFLRSAAFTSAALAANPDWAVGQVMGTPTSFTDYRALVCVFLLGGNDSFNMVVPRSGAEYTAYAGTRQNLAVAQGDLLPITPIDAGDVQYGLHPAMPGLRELFESGRAAFVTNMGPLVQPTTKDSFLNGDVALPPRLFSHNDQQDQWHALNGASPRRTGWAGRIADLIQAAVTNQQFSTNVSLASNSLFQVGEETVPYTMGMSGPVPFAALEDTSFWRSQRLAFEAIVNAKYESMYARAFADVQLRAIDGANRLITAMQQAPQLSTAFPMSLLGKQLQTVARLISVRDELEMRRQIFFVAAGGFDTHDAQLATQPDLFWNVSEALKAFHSATVELGVAHAVATFTQSDFGRTLTSNGDGTDHAWGGIQTVISDSVIGRRLYGNYPTLELGGPEEVGGGRMIPSVSADQYAATLAKWFGIADDDLDQVAPNLSNFSIRDLGFLS